MTADRTYDIRFNCLRNAIYHAARKRFLDGLNRILSFIIIAAGTTAVGDLGTKFGLGSAQLYAAAAAIAGTLQLVFDFGVKARTHDFLQRQYYELLASISETANPSELDAQKWEAILLRLYADEPPPMRALDAIAYNAAHESLDPNQGKRVRVRWHQSLFSQIYPFNQSEFPWVSGTKAS